MRRCGLALLVVLFAGSTGRAEVVNRIVATIDGEPVTLHEVQQFVRDRAGRSLPAGATHDFAAVLDAYVVEKIIRMEVKEQGISVREEDIDRYIEGIRVQNGLNEEQLRRAVELQGLTWEGYRQRVREEIEKAQLINREIRGKVNVTPEDVQRYYQAHKDEYATPEELQVRHIVLLLPPDASEDQVERVLGRARELRARIERGEDFAELARQYSEDAAASSGGDLGTLRPGEMLEEFEAAVRKLKPGEVSQPVRTRVGVHLIRLERKSGASQKPLAELAEEIKKKLYDATLEERYQRWLREDLRRRHHVEMRP